MHVIWFFWRLMKEASPLWAEPINVVHIGWNPLPTYCVFASHGHHLFLLLLCVFILWLHVILNKIMYASLKWKYLDQVWYQSRSSIHVNCKCMITRGKLQRGEGKLKSFDPEMGHATRRGNMAYEDAWLEEEWNYHKAFYAMVEKWTNCLQSMRRQWRNHRRMKYQMIMPRWIMKEEENNLLSLPLHLRVKFLLLCLLVILEVEKLIKKIPFSS